MVALAEVRAHNASLKALGPGLVAVFVGGTSGIGYSTARELVRSTDSPRVYLVGRSEADAARIIPEFNQINPSAKVEFLKSDVSLLKNVDETCKQIKEKESKVNLLFMTIGYVTLSGRNETTEGLDHKFSLHYYARMRFVDQLSPLLTAAGTSTSGSSSLAPVSRVVSVLDPQIGRHTTPNFSDLSLKDTFSLKNCGVHASSMNSYAMEQLSQDLPQTSFIHAYPSGVATGAMRGLGWFARPAVPIMKVLFAPLMVDLRESGERHLFASTAPRFATRAAGAKVEGVAKGSDDVNGSGSYQLNWNGDVFGESKKMAGIRREGAPKKIWEHTEEVFRKIREDGKY